MKRLLVIALLGAACTVAAVAQTAAEKEVLAVEKEWNALNLKMDYAKLDRILAKEYCGVDADLTSYTRAECFDSSKIPQAKALESKIEGLSVRIYGESAIVTGVWKTTALRDGAKQKKTRRFVDMFVHRDGRWQAVYSQNTLVQGK